MTKKSKRHAKTSRPSSRPEGAASGAPTLLQAAVDLHDTIERLERKADQVHSGIDLAHRKVDAAYQKIHPDADGVPAKGASMPFPIVGIGASAGGLEAMKQLLEHLPTRTGMAFVLVQHLAPTHQSALASLLARVTNLPVTEAKNDAPLRPDRVYIIPPNKVIEVARRRLRLFPRQPGKEEHTPIDHFLHSLAEEEGEHAIGIVLSGNGSDGTAGLLAVRAAGGITFAQDTKTAKFPSMPANADAAGGVDFVGSPKKIADELTRIGGQLNHAALPEKGLEADHSKEGKAFEEILILLRRQTGVDFAFYKHATLRRRMHRRLMLTKIGSLREYNQHLRTHPGEVKELFRDILIHVTSFFRDPEVFQTLKKKILPRLLKDKSTDNPLRIWIPGCSTGQEAYSIAITVMELITEKRMRCPVQIFGTDINEAALEAARAGIFPESIKADVSAEQLRRFFTKADGGYRINKNIRQMCIFARQNMVNDPPFSNLDLISCRNVLIYFGPVLQRKVMPVFHYALRPGGLLMLGVSESIGGFADLFSLLDKKAKVYSRKSTLTRPAVSFGHALQMATPGEREQLVPAEQFVPGLSDVQKQADRIILTNYSPAGAIINRQMEVLQFRGRTGVYLEHAHGEASLNLLKMAREGLTHDLRATVNKAIKRNIRVRQEDVRFKQNGHFLECNIEVIPFKVPHAQESFYLVVFEPRSVLPPADGSRKRFRNLKSSSRRNEEVAILREELDATRESLQATFVEQEATNEELRSANEEIMSSNEELQSTNEELETAKEELQSTNEELTTLNDEMESRNIELEQVNNDLHNLLASVNIPVIILGADLRIRRFTTAAEKMFKLINTDVGRPITDINLPVEIPHLDKLVLEVFDSLAPKDLELPDQQGHWWSVRIRAYKTTDHKIEGAVIALFDVDLLKKSAERIRWGRDFAEAIVNTMREPLLVLDKNLVVKRANQTFYQKFKVQPGETIDRNIYQLGNGQWDIPALRTLLEEILRDNASFDDFAVEHLFPGIGRKRMLLNARRLAFEEETEQMILLAIEDVTEADYSKR